MKRSSEQTSCLVKQKPAYIINVQTGEILNNTQVKNDYIIPFLKCVRDKTIETINNDKQRIISIIENENKITQPTGLAWKHNIRPQLDDIKTQKILAVSRIEKIIQHRIVSELSSYVNNPNPNKNEPTFNVMKANLAAADKQIAKVTYDLELRKIYLSWKCWTKELLFVFNLPEFVFRYNIKKYCLPTIHYNDNTKQIEFDFPFVENLDYSQNQYHHCYGAYDSGRVLPYVLTFKNHKQKIIAEYKPSGRCCALNKKRNNILENVKHINKKLSQYDALKLPDNYAKRLILKEEKKCLRRKAKKLGKVLAQLMASEIAGLCEKHQAAVLAAEDLSWVSDKHGSSRWNFSVQQDSVAHAVQRVGTVFVCVSAVNSSQKCCKCGSNNVIHDNKHRVVKCKDCKSEVDRDLSASRVLSDRCVSFYKKYIRKVDLTSIKMKC